MCFYVFLYCDIVAILWISTQSLIHPLHMSYSNGFRCGNIFTGTCCQLYASEYDFWHRHDGSALMHSTCCIWDFVNKWLKETLPPSAVLVWGCTATPYSDQLLPRCGMYRPQRLRTTLSSAALVWSLISGLTSRFCHKTRPYHCICHFP
jgi:hypothetical protein